MASRLDSESPSKASRQKAEAHPTPPLPNSPTAPGSPPKRPKRLPAVAGGRPESEQPENQEARPASPGMLGQMPALVISMLLHIVVLLLMALIAGESSRVEKPTIITSRVSDDAEEFSEFEEPSETADPADMSDFMADVMVTTEVVMTPVEAVAIADELEAAPLAVELADFGGETLLTSDMLVTIGASGAATEGFAGRANPSQMAAKGGGTAGSETAVDAALKWFAAHQLPNGGWTTQFDQCPSCRGKCGNPATRISACADPASSTALALLPFLARGYTHREGPYKEVVERGLVFLARTVVENRGRAYETRNDHGSYVQGLAAIALCEAYGMSQDAALAGPAQLALNFIQDSQDPVGGGWMYYPRQPGGTSATAFMVMALKSGHMARLEINPETIQKTSAFLDSMASDNGSRYGYTKEDKAPRDSLAPAGVLCRMYLGWPKQHPGIRLAVNRIAEKGPDPGNIYRNYYATQVMHHYGGEPWLAWNPRMRDLLIATQSKQGHETGSWMFANDPVAVQAGRLYATSFAALTLEVYYRHLPIYKQQGFAAESFQE